MGDLLNLVGDGPCPVMWPSGKPMWHRFAPHPFAVYPIDEDGNMLKYEDVSKGWAMNTAEQGQIVHIAEHGIEYVWEVQSSSPEDTGASAPESAN